MRIATLGLLIPVLLVLGCAIRFHYSFRDALLSILFWPFESTRWTDDYSEDRFDLAAQSTSEDEIVQIMGEPLTKLCMEKDGSCTLRYTWTGTRPCCNGYEGYFHRREFRIDAEGKIVTARREFDLD